MKLTNDELLEAINKRHSVRTYIDKPIEEEKIAALEALIEECNKESGLHLQFVKEAGDTCNRFFNKSSGLGTAPSVIACIGPNSDDLNEKCGYYGEKIVLLAQHLGLNTCWVGTFNKSECQATVQKGEKFPAVIAIGYGSTNGNERKCKCFEDVTEVNGTVPEWFISGVEAALKAPTAINQQKFMIKYGQNDQVNITDKGGVLSGIDLGIVKLHFEIGSNRTL